MRRLLLILLLAPLPAPAADEASISVKPVLCIVDARAPACTLEFRVRWQTRRTGYRCVRAGDDDGPLRCWAAADRGSVTDARRVTDSFDYSLTSGEDSLVLATTSVEVVRKAGEDRRRRRRTRHVWDIL